MLCLHFQSICVPQTKKIYKNLLIFIDALGLQGLICCTESSETHKTNKMYAQKNIAEIHLNRLRVLWFLCGI